MQVPTRTRRPPVLALIVAVSLASAEAAAETVTGRLNGLRCADGGHFCPVSNIDAHMSFERDFVLQQPDGDYYRLSNVPRDTKVRHVLKEAKVIGEVVERSRSISVDALMVEENGRYRTVWTPAMQQEAFEQVFSADWRGAAAGAAHADGGP